MNQGEETTTPDMRRVHAQVEVLVPLLKRLREKLGEEEANALIYPVIRESMKDWAATLLATGSGDLLKDFASHSDALEAMYEVDVAYDTLKNDETVYEFNITGCRYAEFFRQLGEPELGTMLVCEMDDHIADLSVPAVEMTRKDTMMKGGSHCPFRYRFDTTNAGD
ncbi:MAG: L-2-amino-thiazoline-4-carboxylic acid hydrolase [Alphaproteobacteria bacterium]|jgi:hypothetical protein|nr:L-2-amino-thiazoline-4-carboxylic acid hydrolase [Rhodospirillaceae bacterium]MDG2481135.1 L-2-amino-thiazoline-4-carboxylic acid hydrolase [Alphaproteobacteria bacterium]MBT6205232.1 L-2-amino-thiazoline-4-carboxylic acid hydrolase [Rhodospirillaceae bacterium]MBT6508862.1 L-2-amino-thiazoline-4-carboxylic acid hydrolase [Rhodospirillaceae bacterium]MBT7613540.1 L-2-amino-thiazoline-4-carboxylic acid hydrolase [Rhodospirillaceae bacterium]